MQGNDQKQQGYDSCIQRAHFTHAVLSKHGVTSYDQTKFTFRCYTYHHSQGDISWGFRCEIFWKTPRGPPSPHPWVFLDLAGAAVSSWWLNNSLLPTYQKWWLSTSKLYMYIHLLYMERFRSKSLQRPSTLFKPWFAGAISNKYIYLCSWNFVGFWVGVRIGCLFGPVGFLVSLVKPFITLEVCSLCAFCTPSRAAGSVRATKHNNQKHCCFTPSSVGWKFFFHKIRAQVIDWVCVGCMLQ